MKVYVLKYWHWDDYSTHGVFTEEAMRQKRIEFAKKQKEDNVPAIEAMQRTIAEKDIKRKEFIRQAEAEILPNQKLAKENGNKQLEKDFKKIRKSLLKQADTLNWEQKKIQREINELEEMNERQLADYFMSKHHLYFYDYDLTETVLEGDWEWKSMC